MSREALLPCIVCGTTLLNVFEDGTSNNQPEEGTEFQTYGHYGSTFWDSFDGEELVLNVCDECLRKYTERLGRQKRFVNLVVADPTGRFKVPSLIGRQWVDRELVPYFDGPEDADQITIEPQDIGVLDKRGEGNFQRIEWIRDWRDQKKHLMEQVREQDQDGRPCGHERHWAECLDCGAAPIEGLK